MISYLLALATGNSSSSHLASSTSVIHSPNWLDLTAQFYLDMSVRGVGQFMFADTTSGGFAILIGIGIASRFGALAAWLGGTLGGITALHVLQVPNRINVRMGLYGYNSAGTCASLAGSVFFHTTPMSIVVGGVGAMLASLLNVAFISFWGTLWNLPVLTFPFITTAWIMIISRSKWLIPLDSKVDFPSSLLEYLAYPLEDYFHCLPLFLSCQHKPYESTHSHIPISIDSSPDSVDPPCNDILEISNVSAV